jgi:hypothetical protein
MVLGPNNVLTNTHKVDVSCVMNNLVTFPTIEARRAPHAHDVDTHRHTAECLRY